MSGTEYEARLTSTGRNDSCPCGSGKKYKKCHLAEDEKQRTAALTALEEAAKAKAEEKAAEEAAEVEAADGDKADAAPAKGAAAKGKGKGAAKQGAKAKRGQPKTKNHAWEGKPKNTPRRSAV